ncbi:hypothetical protein K504DRAFT_498646 [Pleomassaria siparia CBS 279.74]|uniref:Uncharacterized protein n=1 Tax=Pleomassaria siparia CBS 279.74 TaxID=1314801 RepID=A0A6G1KLY4_9PLEO|nr:hypothetical protein K504DRAFT_498646 [Pleomassaria siparia CBS 279.74]
MPTVIQTKKNSPSSSFSSPSSPKKDRSVGFMKDPVSGLSRPVNSAESWAAYNFEMHARKCAYCHNPYEVHRAHDQLCDVGHRLAQDVAHFIYNQANGMTYSTVEEDHKLVRVEIPASYDEVRGLLKAIERSLRYRSRTPFVSQDRTYHVAARIAVPQKSRSVKVDQTTKPKSRPRSGEIVDWPSTPKVSSKPKATVPLAEINSSLNTKRGSLYESDVAAERRNAQRYSVEVREPSVRDLREHRLSGYYR